jgi:3-hydroxymyristoyl/3-hydroxydecanoyl-(acyl carrier protein) dehydratase
MDGHFRAFSFVDRIHPPEREGQIRGSYAIPASIVAFPPALVAEAVGQLAAWVAMATMDFRRRPVAGLASSMELLATVRPGQLLELAVDLETVDAEAAAYHGTAQADGVPLIQLRHCVGPMVPVEEFDAPQALRDRFALLCGPGAIPGAFAGVPPLRLHRTDGEEGRTLCATLAVPDATTPFFSDHFPRRRVLPGTLLMQANLELAGALAGQLPPPSAGARWKPRAVSHLKLRDFVPPGETVEIAAQLHRMCSDHVSLMVQTRKAGRVIGSVQVQFVPEESP